MVFRGILKYTIVTTVNSYLVSFSTLDLGHKGHSRGSYYNFIGVQSYFQVARGISWYLWYLKVYKSYYREFLFS